MKFKNLTKTEKIYTVLILGLLFASLTLTVFRYEESLKRLLTAFFDLGRSFGLYILKIFFNVKNTTVRASVLDIPKIDIQKFIPFDLSELERKWHALGPALVQKEWLLNYLKWLTTKLRLFLMGMLMLLPVVLLVGVAFKNIMLSPRDPEEHNVDSRPLRIFKKICLVPGKKIYVRIRDFFRFFQEKKRYVITLVLIWVVNLNIATIIVEFFAFYLHFACEFKFIDIPGQLFKLLIDLIIMFSGAPLVFWIFAGFVVFDKIRKYIGYDRLEHNELKNRGFINSLPIVVLLCGPMGVSKTTMLADMVLSQNDMFREKACEKMFQIRNRFPHFPWVILEARLKGMILRGDLPNLAFVRSWIREKKQRDSFGAYVGWCFEYDPMFPDVYNDHLKVSDIWELIETYAQLYYIYTFDRSLAVANFSVRDVNDVDDIDNFPLRQSDFFRGPSVPLEDDAGHSLVLDFDILRPGAKLSPDSGNYGLFEFGVVAITEVGKERGNNLELRETKKKADYANQKNDLFNQWLKMCRHSATVDNFPFIRVFCDEQRPESWGADARDLAAVVWIREKEELKITMPGFLFGDILYDMIAPGWYKFSKEYAYNRGDNTLTMFLVKSLVTSFLCHRERIYNTFGYHRLRIETEQGTMDGELEEHEYLISTKKDYSKVFSTDCFSDYFAEKALACGKGLGDLTEYKTERATFDELRQQNSYFVNGLLGEDTDSKDK